MNAWLKIALLSCLPLTTYAHTVSPYVLPEVFDTTASNVSFQSAMTVEKFFVPTSNFKTNYLITAPNGENTALQPAAALKRFSIAETELKDAGTYRIRTQDAMGNPGKYALVDGRWLRVRAAAMNNMQPRPAMPAAPASAANTAPKPATPTIPRFVNEADLAKDAQIIEVRNHYIAEAYVTRAKPSAIPAVTNKGFEVKLITHPNEVYAGEGFKGQILNNGKPVANLEVDVFKGAGTYDLDAKRDASHVKTNAKGEFEIKFEQPGIYLITTAYPEASNDNTKKPSTDNYTYGLTLEVVQ